MPTRETKLNRRQLLHHFDWCLSKPEAPWEEYNYMGIFTHSDMWVVATERRVDA